MAPRLQKRVPPAGGRTRGRRTTKEEAADRKGPRKTGPGRSRRIDKSRGKGKKTKYKLKLKKWLQTPADWARFNAWAKINAQPKKYPEPEPIVRPSKPLYQLTRRLKILAIPRTGIDPKIHCRLDFDISKAALETVATRRTILLALPNVRLVDYGRVYYKVSPAALKYEASERILELSQPRPLFLPEECRSQKLSRCARKQFSMERLNRLALAKKLAACPQALTPEELAMLFTPAGVRRSALKYEITAWMEFLALPPYKTIRHRNDKDAVVWKKQIIKEGEKRGKSALAEREEKSEKKGKKRKREETEDAGAGGDRKEDDEEKKEEKERRAKRRKIEKHKWRYAPHPCHDDPFTLKRGALTGKVPPGTEKLAKAKDREDRVTRSDAFRVKKAALSAAASERTENLAKPTRPRSPVERKPPREKNKYGKPIFQMPVYGKVLPKTKPYKMGECPPAKEERKVAKERPIDPIAYELTIDPCIYPDLARKQRGERKRAEKLLPKDKRRRKGRQRKKRDKREDVEENEEQASEEEEVPGEEEPPDEKEVPTEDQVSAKEEVPDEEQVSDEEKEIQAQEE